MSVSTSEANKKKRSATRTALEGFAIFEASKGLIVLVVGLGLFSVMQFNIQDQADDIVRFLRLNPAHGFPRIFIHAMSHLENPQLLLLSISALMYAALRFVEAGGLWLDQAWAEWLAIIADSLFLPVEIFEITRKVTTVRVCILLLNIAIVVFLATVVYRRMKERKRGAAAP